MSKYNSVSCQCIKKHVHASRAEAAYCNKLWVMTRDKKRGWYCYSTQKTYSLDVNGHHICNHIVDFALMDKKRNVLEVIEIKGFATAVWKIKYKLFKALYPEIPYRIIKANQITG
jgi:hypothetical protein